MWEPEVQCKARSEQAHCTVGARAPGGFSSFSSPVTLCELLPVGHMMDMKEHWSLGLPPEEMELTQVGKQQSEDKKSLVPRPGCLPDQGKQSWGLTWASLKCSSWV